MSYHHQLVLTSPASDGWVLFAFSRPRCGPYGVSSLVGRGSGRSREERRLYDDLIATFIAIIINSLDEAKAERPPEMESPITQEQLLSELRAAQATLERLEKRLQQGEDRPKQD